MERRVRINEHCFIRNQVCGRAFEGSGICFIACPYSDDLSLEISVVKTILRDHSVEPYVAVENFEPGKDIFCEKICAKIIESQFCVVLLSDVKPQSAENEIPNPNVYYEYGLMVALHKVLIPLQREGAPLAFNIQSLDTLTYNPKSLGGIFQTSLKRVLLNPPSIGGSFQKYDCLNLYRRLSELENWRFIAMDELFDPWSGILKSTVFELRQGPTLVADFTNAYTINTVVSETTILLNHLSNEISSLENQITKAPQGEARERAESYITFGIPEKTTGDLEAELYPIQHADILLIIPNGWKSDVEKQYTNIEHTYKPELNLIEERQVIDRAVIAGLAPQLQ